MDTVQIALCDTSRESVSYYSRLFDRIATKKNINLEITECYSAEQLLYEMASSANKYQLLLLNISLGKMDGVILAEHLRNMNCTTPIIFTFSGTELTFDVLQTNAIALIDKNAAADSEIETVLTKIIYQCSQNRTFTIDTSSAMLEISAEAIKYFEFRGPLALVHCSNHIIYYCRNTATGIANIFPDFINTCNGFMINPKYVEQVEHYRIILSTGQNIPLNPEKYNTIKNAFTAYLINKF